MDARKFVDLSRKFIPVSAIGDDPEVSVRVARALRGLQDWATVLAHGHVVVLGEAGTGKTTEFRCQTQLLTDQGRYAFSVDIATLISRGLPAGLDASRFEKWRAGDDEAVFFLDALDEAKLKSGTLHEALISLRSSVNDGWSRLRIVLSCRASDWRAEADLDELKAHMGGPVHVVQLAPLDEEQVAKLVRIRGVNDADAFMAAIADSYAQIFVERPLDVVWLAAYWLRHERIGSMKELIQDDVNEKLREVNQKRLSKLTRNKLEEALCVLAGVGILRNTRFFLVPDEPHDARQAVDAIDPLEFLPDWSQSDIRELLSRAIFDEATYGKVRLHHRTVHEYLAAKWFAGLTSKGLPPESVAQLFFRDVEGDEAIPAHLGPVAAWLALWDEPLRARLIHRAPALAIAYGDPSGFSEEERIEILRSFAGAYKLRSRQYNRFDRAALRRFSVPPQQVQSLLEAIDTPDELAGILLELVQHGRISSCAQTCLNIALDARRSEDVRFFAIRATAAIGTNEHRTSLVALLDTTPEWENQLAGAFVSALYPDYLDADGVVRMLKRTSLGRRNVTARLAAAFEYEVPKRGSLSQRLNLMRALLDVVWTEDAAGIRTVPQRRQAWLPMLAQLVVSVLDECSGFVPGEDVLTALDVFRWCQERCLDIWHGLDKVKEAVARHSEVRRKLFWRRAAAQKPLPTRYYELTQPYQLFEPTVADQEWLASDARKRGDVREQLLAFDTLYRIRVPDGILRAVADGIPALVRRLERTLRHVEDRYSPARYWELRSRARARVKARLQAADRDNLSNRLESIREGRDVRALTFLYQKAGGPRGSGYYGGQNIQKLCATFGEEIATAAVVGWCRFWRTSEPPLPHECEERNRIPSTIPIGIVGLGFEFSGGLLAGTMESAEARKATRYAVWEMSSFPAWMGDLALAHPSVVVDVLGPAIAADFAYPDNGEPINDVLAKLPRAAEPISQILVPCLVDLLRGPEAPVLYALNCALDVVLRHGTVGEEFRTHVALRCSASLKRPDRLAIWWDAWLTLDWMGALNFVECLLRDISPNAAYAVSLHVLHEIYKRTQTYTTRSFFGRDNPHILKRLIPLVFEQIKGEHDIEHEGVHSPGLRDHAQEVRSRLIAWLGEIPGSESVQALRELAEDARLGAIRDWLLHVADQRVIANASTAGTEVETKLLNLTRTHGTAVADNLGELVVQTSMVKILFLASDPSSENPLCLNEECREIEEKLRGSRDRALFEFKSRWAVRPGDLQQLLLEECPTIVHFSGHGAGKDGLVFHSANGEGSLVSGSALRSMFRALKRNIKIVLLNACLSVEQATSIVDEIDFVVGMSDLIDDGAARVFAAAFYRALAFGMSVQTAFDLGVNALELEGSTDALLPTLFVKQGADASQSLVRESRAI